MGVCICLDHFENKNIKLFHEASSDSVSSTSARNSLAFSLQRRDISNEIRGKVR